MGSDGRVGSGHAAFLDVQCESAGRLEEFRSEDGEGVGARIILARK
jgi:hypothetical protein